MIPLIRITPLLLAAFLWTGCAGPEESQVRQVEKLERDGFVRGAFEESQRLLADKEALAPEQQARLQRIYDESRARLVRFYASLVNQQLHADNFQDALTTYLQGLEEYPELAQHHSLNRRVMRAFVRENNIAMARVTAQSILVNGPGPADRADAEAFIASLDELREASETRQVLSQRVALIGASIGVDFANIQFAPSCVVMNELNQLSEDSARTVDQYMSALMTESTLQAKLGEIPTAIN